MSSDKKDAAKFAFFYMLSLVALVFMALAAGMVIFQFINKEILDIINQYSGSYSDSQMRFAISSLAVSTPIYYITTRQIYKNLYSGELDQDAGVRKWLTYLILLVAVVVMLGWLIAILNNFLEGEVTTKFILKALTALLISGSIFSFYLYDMKRDNVKGAKDNKIRIYFYTSLAVILIIFVTALFTVDSPAETRKKKIDNQVINNFAQIEGALNNYYHDYEKLPESMSDLQDEYGYLSNEDLQNPLTQEAYTYRALDERKYELCTVFQSTNKEDIEDYDKYMSDRWLHDAGYQCLSQKVTKGDPDFPRPIY